MRAGDAWLQGATAIDNLMEDTATAEISRAQLWQWVWNEVPLADGTGGHRVTADLYRRIRDEELAKLGSGGRLKDAAAILDELVLSRDFLPFLTLIAYPRLE